MRNLSDKPVSQSELIELTKAYVALSNAHQLQFVLPMFDENATYFSVFVGEFKRRGKIGEMMADFFSRYTDVHWLADEYQFLGDAAVGFNFVMTATDSQGGEPISRSAYEILRFNHQGYIALLQVKEP